MRVGPVSAFIEGMIPRSLGVVLLMCSACGSAQLAGSGPLVPEAAPPPSAAATEPVVRSFETKTIGGERFTAGRPATGSNVEPARATTTAPAGGTAWGPTPVNGTMSPSPPSRGTPVYGDLNPSPPSPGTPQYGNFNPNPPSRGTPRYGDLNPSPPGR